MIVTLMAGMGMKKTCIYGGENGRWGMMNCWCHKHGLCNTRTQKSCLFHHDTHKGLIIDRQLRTISRCGDAADLRRHRAHYVVTVIMHHRSCVGVAGGFPVQRTNNATFWSLFIAMLNKLLTRQCRQRKMHFKPVDNTLKVTCLIEIDRLPQLQISLHWLCKGSTSIPGKTITEIVQTVQKGIYPWMLPGLYNFA